MYVHLRIFFLALLLCLPSVAYAFEKGRADELCRAIFGGVEWSASIDLEAEQLASEFLREGRINAIPVICSGTPADHSTIAASQKRSHGFETYFFFAFHGEFRLAIGDELRGVIAHEVAHEVVAPRGPCGKRSSAGSGWSDEEFREYILCESRVDRAAAGWVGKQEMIRALLFTIGHVQRAYGHRDMDGNRLVQGLELRIWNLERP